jgi:hypothetical protein
MKLTKAFSKIRCRFLPILTISFLISACRIPTSTIPAIQATNTLSPIYPTSTITPLPPTDTPTSTDTPTPTLTPSPKPTNTPTLTPTSVGGTGGLLLQAEYFQENNYAQQLFLYNLVTDELDPLIDGYSTLDISPDGSKVLLMKYTDEFGETGDSYILNLKQPGQITLLQENIADAVWLSDSAWIGIIKMDSVRQGFILHPDGSELTQVTHSAVGVVEILPVFNDGIFWSEGTVSRYNIYITGHFWNKLDGTQTKIINFESIATSGKYIITRSTEDYDKYLLIDLATNESTDLQIPAPDTYLDPTISDIRVLSDEKWMVGISSQKQNSWNYWIYSFNEMRLTNPVRLPDEYGIVSASSPPQPYGLLSPDGTWVLISKSEQLSSEQYKTSYALFNTTTSEIKSMPGVYAIETGAKVIGNKRISGEIDGCQVWKYFWVQLP